MTEVERTTSQLLLSSISGGPFISGSSHKLLQLGQLCSRDRLQKEKKAKSGVKRQKQDGTAGRSTRSRSAPTEPEKKKKQDKRQGALQIKDLIDAGLIKAGKSNVTVNYKGVTYTAVLNSDGSITYDGQQFVAASAFSVHVKRLQTPHKQGDDGWKSVHVDGVPLEEWRSQLLAAGRPSPSPAPAEVEEEAEADAAEPGAGEAAADATHWVQCSSCEQWRVVPDECWPQLQDSMQDEWYCKDAWWDLTDFEPFTEACADGDGAAGG